MNRQGGLTVVETTLAMAISTAALVLVAGLAVNAGNKRFQNTMNEVRSFVQTQYDEVRTGINSRLGGRTLKFSDGSVCYNDGSSAAGNSKCYVIGRLLEFNNGSNMITSKYVVAVPRGSNWPNDEKSGLENLDSSYVKLHVIDASSYGGGDVGVDSMKKIMSDGSTIKKLINFEDSGYSTTGANRIAILHSPVNSSIITVFKPGSGDILSINTSYNNNDYIKAVVVENGSTGYSRGLICIKGGDDASNVAVNYNSTARPADYAGIKDECNNLWKEPTT